ncbi:MAG: hypothetical protein J7K65_08690 [Planctomycetes bacterium]|nr:hypothetical protein [Planctomycetota bacterium]
MGKKRMNCLRRGYFHSFQTPANRSQILKTKADKIDRRKSLGDRKLKNPTFGFENYFTVGLEERKIYGANRTNDANR